MFRPTIILVVAAALAATLTITLTAPASTVKQRETYQGKTAMQWHHLALKRRVALQQARMRLGTSIRYTRRLQRANRHLAAQDTVLTSQIERNFLCIHGYEGSWTDPNAPYYGGLQMDDSFQRTYGPEFYREWGSADHWPASVQIAVAIKAYLSGRGYHPWPNTARYCGLL